MKPNPFTRKRLMPGHYHKTSMSLVALTCLGLWSGVWAAEPIASFTATPSSGAAPLAITLNAGASSDSDGAVVEHNWSIDGQLVSLATVTPEFEVVGGSVHTVTIDGTDYTVTRRTLDVVFKAEGTYTVGLKVKDNDGLFSDTPVKEVVVGCTYSITPSSRSHGAGAENAMVSVNTQSGCDWSAVSNTSWAGITDGDSGTGSGDVTYAVQANTSGQQRAGTLTIAGNAFSLTQEQAKQSPVASFIASPDHGPAPLNATLDYSGSYDPDGQIVDYTWSVNGSPLWLQTSALEKSITFDVPGTYTVGLTVTDNDGLTDHTEQTVVVGSANQAPVASFTATPEKGPVPLKVALDYSASHDPDGEIVDYAWAVNGTPLGLSASALEKFITFELPGTYTISLTVTDNGGLTDTASQQVVAEGAAALSITPEQHDFGSMPILAGASQSQVQARRASADLNAQYAPDRVIVKFRDNATHSARRAVRTSQNVNLLEELPSINAEVWQVDDVAAFISAQASVLGEEVEYIEPDYIVTASAFPNDPNFNQLWGMHNTGQTGGTSDADTDAPEAWDVSQGDNATVCAVIDTGVDYNHPDLAANMWHNPGEIPANGIDDDNNGYIDDVYGYDFFNDDSDPFDDNIYGHGTHVAGTMAAVGNNGIGVAGVNWTGKVAAVKFLSALGWGYTSDAVRAVEYANKMGFRCSNNSWGGGAYSQALYDAIRAGGDNGALFVAAAGNYHENRDINPSYPASYDLPNIISVCATDHNDQLASWSDYGQQSVDLCAPGVSILSTLSGNQYGFMDGTSMASPHVTGAVALLWAAQPDLSAAQVKAKLMASVDVKSNLQGLSVTGGRLNLAASLDKLVYPQAFLVSNNGSTAVTLSQVGLSGQNPADFEIRRNTCGNSLEPGDTCIVTVSFAPAATGDKQALLTVDATNASATAMLSGTATTIGGMALSHVGAPLGTPSIYTAQTGQAYLPTVYIAGNSAQAYSVKLCPTGGAFNVCEVVPKTGGLQAEADAAIYDPQRGVLYIPFVRLQTVSESGEVTVAPGGYSVEMQVNVLPQGGMSLQLKQVMPVMW